MSALSRWFRLQPASPADPGSKTKERRLADLEAAAKGAAPGYQGTPLNRAGDLCLKEGDHRRALAYYGRAINTFLEDRQPEAARGVANKIIRIHPEAVRTLCTLTWLDLAAGHLATALIHLVNYKDASQRSASEPLAAEHILTMAKMIPQPEFVDAAADALDQLGYPDEASVARQWAKNGGSEESLKDPDELTAYCITEALGRDKPDGG